MIRIPSAPAWALSAETGTFAGVLNGFIPLRDKRVEGEPDGRGHRRDRYRLKNRVSQYFHSAQYKVGPLKLQLC